MNKLHLDYVRETGNRPQYDIYLAYIEDTKLYDPDGIIKKWIESLNVDILYTHEYIEWLENKLNT
jgi:hypothetical protein